jgi:hypothetical protein
MNIEAHVADRFVDDPSPYVRCKTVCPGRRADRSSMDAVAAVVSRSGKTGEGFRRYHPSRWVPILPTCSRR